MGKVVEFEKIAQEEIHADLGEVFRGAIRMSLEMLLEEEVKAMVGARRYERTVTRRGQRNGTFLRGLLTSMGHIDVRVPRTREGSAAGVIGTYQRRSDEVDELVTEAYVSGVSQRKMADLTEGLMGKRVSRSVVSRVAKRLEQTVEQLRTEKLEQPFPYLYLDATFIDARWARRVENVSALVAYGVGEDGFRHLLGVHIGPQESEESWSELLSLLVDRGLRGVVLVISDDHAGLKAAVRTWFPEADHQRCTVHVQRNVVAKAPRRLHKRLAGEVGFVFKASSKKQAGERLEEFEARWSKELPEAVACLKNAFEAATRFYDFPEAHWVRIRTTNGIERLNGEIKRRTRAVGAFPDRESALRLIANVAIRTCARWGQKRYLDMGLLREEVDQAA
ncbi:IS256 family transposase [Myxococcota bacterium]